MNASQSTLLRALRAVGYASLFLTVFPSCSGNDANAPLPPPGPASVEIMGIALGQGFYGDGNAGASSTLACDHKIGVNVQTEYWTLLGPGKCGGALQCGQLRVILLRDDAPDAPLTVVAAGNGVALDVGSLTPPIVAGHYTIRVELVDDAGKTYVPVDGGNGSAEQGFELNLPSGCAGSGGATGT